MISQNPPYKAVYHPLEIAFCGYSGSGKTTLISSIVKKLSGNYDIGYLKHDAHHFIMDKEGKDTFVIKSSGARIISIHDQEQMAIIDQRSSVEKLIEPGRNLTLLKSDFLLVEGLKHGSIPKIVVLGPLEQSNKILEDFRVGKLHNVLAFVGQSQNCPFETDIAYFERNQIDQISNFIVQSLKNRISQDILGLVLIGGHSKRMGTDKFSIEYAKATQLERVYNTISQVCSEIYISCRQDQFEDPRLISYEKKLVDQFYNIGPLGAILSAFQKFPNHAIMTIACDLPLLGEQEIKLLQMKRNPFKFATSFLNPEGLPEPLCAIYEPKAKAMMHAFFGLGYHCPRKMLMNMNISGIKNYNYQALSNANTPEEREAIRSLMENYE